MDRSCHGKVRGDGLGEIEKRRGEKENPSATVHYCSATNDETDDALLDPATALHRPRGAQPIRTGGAGPPSASLCGRPWSAADDGQAAGLGHAMGKQSLEVSLQSDRRAQVNKAPPGRVAHHQSNVLDSIYANANYSHIYFRFQVCVFSASNWPSHFEIKCDLRAALMMSA